jgi:hypothetical protein
MASNHQHNQLIKIVFDGNKHLKHVLSDDQIKQMTMIEGRWPLTKSPVCGHCERLGLWHKDSVTGKPVGVCRTCGTITKSPVTYASYLASGMDVDETGHTFRAVDGASRRKDKQNREIYLPDFRRLEK